MVRAKIKLPLLQSDVAFKFLMLERGEVYCMHGYVSIIRAHICITYIYNDHSLSLR